MLPHEQIGRQRFRPPPQPGDALDRPVREADHDRCHTGDVNQVRLQHGQSDASGAAEKSAAWLKASRDKKFCQVFTPAGDALINAPRGYAKDHPLLEDLKRKDFIAISGFSRTLATRARFQSA